MNYFLRQLLLLIQIYFFPKQKNKNKNPELVYFLFWPKTPWDYVNYFGRAYVLQDFTLYRALTYKYSNVKFINPSRLDYLKNDSKVYYSAVPFKKIKDENQGESLYRFLKNFNLDFYPKPKEIRFWENKIWMHKQFILHKIPHPKTIILENYSDKLYKLKFPVLTKIPDGNHSRGIVSHDRRADFDNYLLKNFELSRGLLVQERLNIEFDIRVVTIRDKVVYHYWRRKNKSDKFSTTSTSNGSRLDISPLPQEIIDICIESSKRLGLNMAAYDVTYIKKENDVLIPMIFEVSPSFLLNPIPADQDLDKTYLEYKKKWIIFNRSRIDQFIELKKLYLN